MKREGRVFDLGQPYITGSGVIYPWPDRAFGEAFDKKWKEMGPVLLEKTRGYLLDFEISEHSSYPYLQESGIRAGLVYHTGMDGKWFTIADEMGYALNCHNLDGYRDKFAAFNVTSDTIELLDEGIEAPRVLIEEGGYVFKYPLPAGSCLVDAERFPQVFDKGWLQKRSDIVKLGEVCGIEVNDRFQEIRINNGKIRIEDGVCGTSGFEGWDSYKPSFIVSQILYSFKIIEEDRKAK